MASVLNWWIGSKRFLRAEAVDTFALDQRFLGTMSWWDSVIGVVCRSGIGQL